MGNNPGRPVQRARLEKMSPSDAEAYLARSMPGYIQERAKAGEISLEQSAQEAAEQRAHALPNGVYTAGHSFFHICDAASGQAVGAAWLFVLAAKNEAFLYDIIIEDGYRRQGYGRSAMRLLANDAKAAGCRHFRLHAWGHNQGALDFYRSLGMITTDVHLSLNLDARRD